MIWLATDTHWNHDNVIVYDNRPPNHKELMIANWKRLVADTDTVIHLGDVIFRNRWELGDILAELPGVKILTVGNHDKRTGTNTWFRRMGFNYVCKSHSYKNVLFSHKPLDLAEYPGIEYNIHGHFHDKVHSDEKYPYYDEERHICLTISRQAYSPVKLAELVDSVE